MNNLSRYYDPLFKQHVVEYHLKNRSNVSLRFVSDIFQIKGGYQTVKRWFDRYDGTIESLQQSRSGRPPILNQRPVGQLIVDTFHEWKERIRQNSLLTEEYLVLTMTNEWYKTREINIKHHYDHCAITYGQNVYKDCPYPLNHRH